MNETYFYVMSAAACGQMVAAFVIALIIGVLSTIGRKKKLGVKAYRRRRGRVMMWTYCIVLILESIQQIDISLILMEAVFSLIVYGIYRFIIHIYHTARDDKVSDDDEEDDDSEDEEDDKKTTSKKSTNHSTKKSKATK